MRADNIIAGIFAALIAVVFITLVVLVATFDPATGEYDILPLNQCEQATKKYNDTGYWAAFFTLRADTDAWTKHRMERILEDAKFNMQSVCGDL